MFDHLQTEARTQIDQRDDRTTEIEYTEDIRRGLRHPCPSDRFDDLLDAQNGDRKLFISYDESDQLDHIIDLDIFAREAVSYNFV